MYPEAHGSHKGGWESVAKDFGWPTFPIVIARDGFGKWHKRPLTAHGHHDASFDPGVFGELWSRANGFGIPMGRISTGVGLYAFDVDTHRVDADADALAWAWLADHGVPLDTRRHRTVSGGIHLLYLLPGNHVSLPSRANIVPGLDSRGQGGWIAFGEGYSRGAVEHMATLPETACAAVLAGYSGGGALQGVEIAVGAYEPPAPAQEPLLRRRILRTIGMSQTLLRRWHAIKSGGDQSRSARDHSVAMLLAMHGLNEAQIAYALLEVYEHGACRDPGVTEWARVRSAMRSAAKACAVLKAAQEAQRRDASRTSKASVEAYLASLQTKGGPGNESGAAKVG